MLSFLHIATTLSQTRQRNGILRRCEKGHRDVQNEARAAEKNAPNVCNNKHNPQIIPKFICWISLLVLCLSMSLSLSIHKLVFINVNLCNCRIINSDKLLPPATKLWQGNVFTPVCHSVHGGVSVPVCTTGHMIGGSLSRGVSVQGGSLSRGVSV